MRFKHSLIHSQFSSLTAVCQQDKTWSIEKFNCSKVSVSDPEGNKDDEDEEVIRRSGARALFNGVSFAISVCIAITEYFK